jgi:hypothetical protein
MIPTCVVIFWTCSFLICILNEYITKLNLSKQDSTVHISILYLRLPLRYVTPQTTPFETSPHTTSPATKRYTPKCHQSKTSPAIKRQEIIISQFWKILHFIIGKFVCFHTMMPALYTDSLVSFFTD